MVEQRFFGTPEQRYVAEKAAALLEIVGNDPRFCTHGRTIGLDARSCADFDMLVALARLQGIGVIDALPNDKVAEYQDRAEAVGLNIDLFAYWHAGPEAVTKCEAYLASHELPNDVTLLRVDDSTTPEQLQEISELLAAVDMMLPMESYVRGHAVPSVYLAAIDANGRPVAHASSTCGTLGVTGDDRIAHWGMLATLPERRGEGMAAWLGAKALVDMHDRHGFNAFCTGIRTGNAPSEGLSGKLGLSKTETSVLLAIDPSVFDGEAITK